MMDSPIRRSGSIALPVFFDRSSLGSTLSLNRSSLKSNVSGHVKLLNKEWEHELDKIPLEQQEWFAGNIDLRTATDRIRNLPPGTFLVRFIGARHSEDFALDLNTKTGVKHMKIYVDYDENLQRKMYSFSQARNFSSLAQLIGFYRSHDLLENFGYKEMEGMKLIIPYKSV